jgi:hypothetical protein
VEILGLTTEGDRRLEVSLAAIGGKGLFVKELEEAMAEGRADIAVHSAKDVPVALPEGYALAAILERGEPRDAFVASRYRDLAALPAGARVGTSSPRRQCLLRSRHPQLIIEPLRGNVDTRVRKLDDGEFDALLLACSLRPACSASAWVTGSPRCWHRKSARPRRGRARWRSSAAPGVATCWRCWRRSTTRTPRAASWRSARSHARSPAAATCRWARTPGSRALACALTGSWARPTARC